MRKLFVSLCVVSCTALLLACPKKKDDAADASENASAAAVDAAPAPAAPVAPTAKNAAEIARFPAAEKPVIDDDAKILDLFAQAKTGPKSGNNVALVKAGTDPVKIADFQDCFLVTFPDPKDPNATLMGWLPKTAFVLNAAAKDAGAKDGASDAAVVDAAAPVADAAVAAAPTKCPAGQELIVNVAPSPVCRKKCAADKDCKTAAAGSCAPAHTQAGKISKVCANEAP